MTTRRSGASSSRIGGPILAPDGGPYPIGTVADAAGGVVVDIEARAQLNALLAALRAADILDT